MTCIMARRARPPSALLHALAVTPSLQGTLATGGWSSGGAQVPTRPPCFLLLGEQVPLVPGNQQSGPRCQSRGPSPHGICWAVGAMFLVPRLNCDICSCPGDCIFSDALSLFKKMDISANPYLACFWGRNRALGEGWFCPVEVPQFQTSPQILSLLCSELG